MPPDALSPSDGSFGLVSAVSVLFGLVIFGYGLLLLPTSALGGAWIAAIGVSLLLSEVVVTDWAGEQFDLSTATQRRLSIGFGLLAAVLVITFVLGNFSTFEVAENASG